jgi:hypothetical protein
MFLSLFCICPVRYFIRISSVRTVAQYTPRSRISSASSSLTARLFREDFDAGNRRKRIGCAIYQDFQVGYAVVFVRFRGISPNILAQQFRHGQYLVCQAKNDVDIWIVTPITCADLEIIQMQFP